MSNSPYDLYSTKATVHAVLLPHNSLPGFCIPIAKLSETSNSLCTLSIDSSGVINGFPTVLHTGKTINLDRQLDVRIGEKEVYAVVDPNGIPIVGTKKEVCAEINKWLGTIEPLVCRLNFALFCNKQRVYERLAAQVFQQKREELKSAQFAARWFVSAFVCMPILHDLMRRSEIINTFDNQEIAADTPNIIIAEEVYIRIYFPDAIFRLLSRTDKFRSKSIDKTIKLAQLATGFKVYIQEPFAETGLTSESLNQISIQTILETDRIRDLKPQERRTAELLSLYIQNPELGSAVISTWLDKSGYANRAARYISENLQLSSNGRSSTVQQVASIIFPLIRIAFPQQRGRVILEFARVLGRHTEIASQLKRALSNTMQREVVEITEAALDFLE